MFKNKHFCNDRGSCGGSSARQLWLYLREHRVAGMEPGSGPELPIACARGSANVSTGTRRGCDVNGWWGSNFFPPAVFCNITFFSWVFLHTKPPQEHTELLPMLLERNNIHQSFIPTLNWQWECPDKGRQDLTIWGWVYHSAPVTRSGSVSLWWLARRQRGIALCFAFLLWEGGRLSAGG